MVDITSSLIAVIIVAASSIDTPFATVCLPADNTIVTSYTVEEIPLAVVEELLASAVDSLVNLGLVFPWKWKRLLVLFPDRQKVSVRSYQPLEASFRSS